MAIYTVPDPSGSGWVDILTSPAAAAQAAVSTGAWVESKHMYLIRGSVGALFLPISRMIEKKKKKNNAGCILISSRYYRHARLMISYFFCVFLLPKRAVVEAVGCDANFSI